MAKVEDNGYPSYTNDDGSGSTGTAIDETFVQAIRDSINAIAHSTTYPTISAADAIDEIWDIINLKNGGVDDWNSLADALDGVIDLSTGSLIAPASVVSTTTLKDAMWGKNLLVNEDMLIWPFGIAADDPPAYWEYTDDAGGTGSVTRETTTIRYAVSSAKIISASTDAAYITQSVLDSTVFPAALVTEAESYSLGCWVYCNVASQAIVRVGDGSATTSASPTSNSTWEWVTLTHDLDGAADSLSVYLRVEENATAYFTCPTLVMGSVPPSRWIPSIKAYGMAVWDFLGPPDTGDGQRKARFARPTKLSGIAAIAGTAPGGGAVTVDLEKYEGGAWASMLSAPLDVLSDGHYAGWKAIDGTYDKRCLNSAWPASGALTQFNDCMVRLNLDAVNAVEDITFFLEGWQYVHPYEGLRAYNDL